MPIDIIHVGGAGMNGRYNVVHDGKLVATISRWGRSRWHLQSVYYSETLAFSGSIDAARTDARQREYPTAEQVYETICRRVEVRRRQMRRKHLAQELGDAALDLAHGSNSAHDRLAELARQIEAFAADRTDVGNHIWGQWDDRMPSYPYPPIDGRSPTFDECRTYDEQHPKKEIAA
jgi:hypothetical protein